VPVDTSRMADDCIGSTTFRVRDLTAIYRQRAHADNPCVIDRLRLIAEHYEPLPKVQVTIRYHGHRVPVGHVEAGLRSGSLAASWPEELNRRVVTLTTRYHFAPTDSAQRNLLAEGVPDQHTPVTGNTVIDALLRAVAALSGRVAPVRVACLGLTFKADVDDLRESPALHIAEELATWVDCELRVYEPFIKELPRSLAGTTKRDDGRQWREGHGRRRRRASACQSLAVWAHSARSAGRQNGDRHAWCPESTPERHFSKFPKQKCSTGGNPEAPRYRRTSCFSNLTRREDARSQSLPLHTARHEPWHWMTAFWPLHRVANETDLSRHARRPDLHSRGAGAEAPQRLALDCLAHQPDFGRHRAHAGGLQSGLIAAEGAPAA
jgi:hypothetical protein